MEHFRLFVLPFWLGAFFLLVTLLYKYIGWFVGLTAAERRLFVRSLFTRSTFRSVGEVISESLLHRKIWRTNKLLGYMHTSFALGWFLLILTGWIETLVYFKGENVPLYVDIFFSYYVHPIFEHNFNFSLIKDALLLLILIGIGLALFKRIRSRMMGMRRTTRHTPGDRIALSALWLIFPARLLAESMTSGVIWKFGGIVWALGEEHHLIPPGVGCGSFLTNSTGELLARILPPDVLMAGELPTWWFYSITLGVFFVALPFSRYMHIFTEIPLIFLRNAGLRSKEKPSSYDHFQTNACSRCGICIDPCQLQRAVGLLPARPAERQPDRCGGQQLLDVRSLRTGLPGRHRTKYAAAEQPPADGRTGRRKPLRIYPGNRPFAGKRQSRLLRRLHDAADPEDPPGDEVWWADKEGGVCCGRPLKLSGEVDAARKMMEYNTELFRQHGIETLVTSCPICLRVFREDYRLEGIEVLHHSEYIQRLLKAHRIDPKIGDLNFTYHDPCELGRGSGIYDAPREVIAAVGRLTEVAENREKALCCGSSLANIAIDDDGQRKIGESVAAAFAATGADAVVTACPLCKKGIARGNSMPVYDLAEIVAQAL